MSVQLEGDMDLVNENEAPTVPADAAIVLTALEAAGGRENRRRISRSVYRATANLTLFADTPGSAGRQLYTRDANERGLGFVTRDRLPLGYGGVIRLPNPKAMDEILSISCTVYRCRMVAPGWYEGSVHFNRDQHAFQPVKTASFRHPLEPTREQNCEAPGTTAPND